MSELRKEIMILLALALRDALISDSEAYVQLIDDFHALVEREKTEAFADGRSEGAADMQRELA